MANLERTQQALAQLVAKGAATQDEVAQNQAALTTARANLQTFQQKKAALEQRASVNVESAELRVKQQQDLVAALEGKVRSATVIAPADGHGLCSAGAQRRFREAGRRAGGNGGPAPRARARVRG